MSYVHTSIMKSSITIPKIGLISTAHVLFGFFFLVSSSSACEITRALFTNDVVDREPVDQVLVLDRDIGRITFFAAASGCKGQVLIHRWEYEGRLVGETRFEVTTPRLRTFSTQEIAPDKIGKWSVLVEDGEGNPLRATIFYHAQLPPQATPGLPTYVVLPVNQE